MKNIVSKLMLIALVLSFGQIFAKEDKVVLQLHHFLSSTSPAHVEFLAPWAENLEKMSKGKIKVQIYPSMTMGGKPNELYKQVRDGTADIVWTVEGYTPGVFPRTEVYALPTVHKGDAVETNLAIKKNFDLIKDDFTSVKPLLVHVHAGNSIHTVSKKITSVEDLKELKLRTPSRTGSWIIEEVGAEPVGMPMPSLPQALSQHTIDGGLIPMEVFPSLKLEEMTKYSAFGEDGSRFGTTAFLLLMNKDRFNNLSKELQGYIEKSLDDEMIKKVGQIWMEVEEKGVQAQANSKDSEVVKISKKELKKFDEVGQRVVDRWIKEVKEKNIDGEKLVKAAREAIKK